MSTSVKMFKCFEGKQTGASNSISAGLCLICTELRASMNRAWWLVGRQPSQVHFHLSGRRRRASFGRRHGVEFTKKAGKRGK